MLTVDDDGVTQAPAPMDLVQGFLNTRDVMHERDGLSDPAAFADWARAAGHELGTGPSQGQVRRARAVREALRSVLIAREAGAYDAEAAAVVARAVEQFGVRPVLGTDGRTRLGHAAQIAAADAVVADVLVRALDPGNADQWLRLKVCLNDECRWAHFDSSRNRSARWCSPKMCGSVMNSRAYRVRRRAAPPNP